MTVAFDFDGTIDDTMLQSLATKLRSERNEIWIVTMRRNDEFNNSVINKVLSNIGVSKLNVIYCNNKPKWECLNAINADIYIDNITDEFEVIKDNSNTIPLLWT